MSWLNDFCHSLSDELGVLTGTVYGIGTEAVTGNPVVAVGVGKEINDFVEQNWQHTCDLPANIADSFSDTGTSSPSFYPDGGAT